MSSEARKGKKTHQLGRHQPQRVKSIVQMFNTNISSMTNYTYFIYHELITKGDMAQQ